MTKYLFVFSILFSFQSIAQQKNTTNSNTSSFVLSGIYTGQNIYFQNPLSDIENKIYCTDSIVINGELYKTDLNRSAYDIDLSSAVKTLGADVNIIIYHKKNCKPKSLSLRGFIPITNKSELTFFEIDTTGHVHITTCNEPPGNKLPYHIDQYRGLKWITVLIIPQKTDVDNTYDTIVKLTAGRNTFRLSEYPYEFSSRMVNVESRIPDVICALDSSTNCITCNDTVYYRLEDTCMNVLSSGYAKNIDVSKLDNARYQMHYDQTLLWFEIKRSVTNKTKDSKNK